MPPSDEELPELRIALAMRGGVSLAVWMGGACSEIDSLRRSPNSANTDGEQPQPGSVTDIYRQLLQASGYGSVAVDVVAGASAGGLNGALMACSVVHDMLFDHRIRNLWLQLGDLGELARPVKGRVEDSALDGDGAFYGPLAAALLKLTDPGAAGNFRSRLDLSLTGTLLDSRRSRRHQDLGPAILETRNRARFRFRHLPMPPGLGLEDDQLSDFGTSSGRERALERLAYAARSTSSFPGAFEPASVGFAPDSDVPPQRHGIPASHHGVFSESRPRTNTAGDRDYVIDGGVLDNIPVAWAIRTIAAAPANVRVDRWLVYLQPLQFGQPKRRREEDPSPGARETVKRARSLQSGTERLSDDIDELERVRSESLRRGGFAQVLEYALGQVPLEEEEPEFLDKLFERALASAGAYRDRLNAIEKDRLRQLWTDPVSVLGLDVLGYNSLEAINSDDQAAADRSALLGDLRRTDYEGVLGMTELANLAARGATPAARREALCAVGRQLRSPQHLARAVALLLDAARSLGEPCLDVKGALYELRSRIELLIACHDRYLAAEPIHSGNDANELVRLAAWRLVRQRQGSSPLPTWGPGTPTDAAWPDSALEDLVRELVDHAKALAASAPPPQAEDAPRERALVNCLLLAAEETANADVATEAVLFAVELLSGPLRPDPLAESGPIHFHMLSAANQSPRPDLRPDGKDLRVADKLAGNQIANFGAFLSAKWRLNDWTWGRLDAAVSLVEIVAAKAEGDPSARQKLQVLAGGDPQASTQALKSRVVERLHERILREELALLTRLDVGAPSRKTLDQATAVVGELDVRPLLEAGRESVAAIIARNPSLWKVAAELGLVAGQSWGVDSVKAGWNTVADKGGDTTAWVGEKTKEFAQKLKGRLFP